jgi:Tfp pilus assembly protein PilF
VNRAALPASPAEAQAEDGDHAAASPPESQGHPTLVDDATEFDGPIEELPDDFEQIEFQAGFEQAPRSAPVQAPPIAPKGVERPAGPSADGDEDDEIDALLDAARPAADFNPTPDFGLDEGSPRTAEPPAVNPPGPPRREPFPLAATPPPPKGVQGGKGGKLAAAFINANFSEEDDGLDTNPFLNDVAHDAASPGPPPAKMPQVSSAEGLADERPAATHIAEANARDPWIARARWFEHEAAAAGDPQTKARLFVVASEIWAMVDDVERARAAAAQAHAAAPTNAVASRQQRWIAAAAGDLKAAAGILEFETRASPSAEARVHAAYLSAELHRIGLNDPANAKKKIDLALRAKPEDARAHVTKWVEELVKGDTVKHAATELAPLEELSRVVRETLALRGSNDEIRSPSVSFERARRALDQGKALDAAEHVLALAEVPELETAALWLGAQLLAPFSAGRPRAIAALTRLAARVPSRAVERTLAARAVEQGDIDSIKKTLASGGGEEAFSAAERVSIGALIGLTAAELAAPMSEVLEDPALRPVAASTIAALSEAPPQLAPGNEQSRSEIVLGQSIAALSATAGSPGSVAVRSAAEQFAAGHPGHPLTRVLNLEFAVADRNAARVASQLSDWPADSGQKDAERDRLLAAGLVHELGGDRIAARTAYSGAFAVDSECEVATRALLNDAPPEQASALLAELAESVTDRSRAALLWCEAALRRGFSEADEYDALLAKAADAAPTIPFAARYGELGARAHGDATRLIKWLRVRRDASADPIERALDQVREALLTADEDMALAASLMAEAIKARPGDIALRELYERLATDSAGGDRGAWRVEAAEHCEGATKLRLLLEAAREYERAGDAEAAARTALTALELGGDAYAELLFERMAPQSSLAPRLSERLLTRARETEDPREQRELYQRLSRLDDARGDHSSALLWQSAILERSPTSLMALRRIEHTYIGAGREDELEPIAATLARELDGSEGPAHAWLVARLRSRAGNWSGARDVIDIAANRPNPPLWALRAQSAHARAAGDDAVAFEADKRLSAEMTQPADAATLLLRAGEAAARLGRLAEARKLIDDACELVPTHLVAFTTRAEILEAVADHVGAAESYEKVAELCTVPAHRFSAWREAGTLWQDKVNELPRAEKALASAAALEPRDFDVFDRLRRLYVASNERVKLAALLEQRLQQTSDPAERLSLEVTRARALIELGDLGAARTALGAALEAAPDHVEALDAYADVCAAEGDWSAAEQAWIRLARQVNDPARQAALYTKLGELYDGAFPNPDRAEVAYNEVLKLKPEDLETTRKLLGVYGKLGKGPQALDLVQGMLDRATTDDDKRDRTILLAVALEQVAGDKKKSEQTLEKARRAWPHDAEVLRAQAAFFKRTGDERALNMLLERATNDSRRALGTGRFDSAFFRIISTAAELRGADDAALIAHTTLHAIEGSPSALLGAGASAAEPSIDDELAPELLSGALRALLKKCGDTLDVAYALDTKAMKASPLPADAAEFDAELQQLAGAFGLPAVEASISPVLGTVCTPLSSSPPRIVIGSALLESPDVGVRTFLVLRALKILQAHAATIARTAPIELWPMIAGWLKVFVPSWTPTGVDAAKTETARARIQGASSHSMDNDAQTLALEVSASIGNRASQLGTAVNQWANRVALVAVGDLSIGLSAIAAAAGQHAAPPADGPDRMKWIVRNSEARDLTVFCVSDAYVDVRRRFGL